MGKSNVAESPNFKKYGVPFYSVAWIPEKLIKSHQNQTADQVSDADKKSQPETDSVTATGDEHYLAFAGGGGEGRSGIPNAVVLARFDAASNTLSDEPVGRRETDSDLPYRMALNPSGDGIICAMPNSCRWFEWDTKKSTETRKFSLKLSEKVLNKLKDIIGQQLALAFNNDGTALAVGGEDGSLKVFKWPSMEIIITEEARSAVKDVHFSFDGKLLISLRSAGPCRVWDLSSSVVVTSLSNENREVFSSCRFSQINDGTQVLYIAAMTDKGGSILTWDTKTWQRVGSKRVVGDPISALNVSADGKFIACGTTSGDILIVKATNMQIQRMIKKAHLGIVTALAFSSDSRALASVSLDSSARVTKIEEKKSGGLSLWFAVFIILLAIAAYYFLELGGVI